MYKYFTWYLLILDHEFMRLYRTSKYIFIKTLFQELVMQYLQINSDNEDENQPITWFYETIMWSCNQTITCLTDFSHVTAISKSRNWLIVITWLELSQSRDCLMADFQSCDYNQLITLLAYCCHMTGNQTITQLADCSDVNPNSNSHVIVWLQPHNCKSD